MTLTASDAWWLGGQWQGYVDSSNQPCGIGDVLYYTEDVNSEWVGHVYFGKAYAWEGRNYGYFHRIHFHNASTLRTYTGFENDTGADYGARTLKFWGGDNQCVNFSDRKTSYENFDIENCSWEYQGG